MIAAPKIAKTAKTIGSPTVRERECQLAMREEFEVLTDLAERLGWHWDEIALAMLELTEGYVSERRLSRFADPLSGGTADETRH